MKKFFDDNIWWHWYNYWQLERQSWRLDIWDTDYNSDNWEPDIMTIIVTWQSIVTLDSIRNSCDVCTPSVKLCTILKSFTNTIIKVWESKDCRKQCCFIFSHLRINICCRHPRYSISGQQWSPWWNAICDFGISLGSGGRWWCGWCSNSRDISNLAANKMGQPVISGQNCKKEARWGKYNYLILSSWTL